jgi:hypothetical protein
VMMVESQHAVWIAGARHCWGSGSPTSKPESVTSATIISPFVKGSIERNCRCFLGRVPGRVEGRIRLLTNVSFHLGVDNGSEMHITNGLTIMCRADRPSIQRTAPGS